MSSKSGVKRMLGLATRKGFGTIGKASLGKGARSLAGAVGGIKKFSSFSPKLPYKPRKRRTYQQYKFGQSHPTSKIAAVSQRMS